MTFSPWRKVHSSLPPARPEEPGQVKHIELDDKSQICLANINGRFYAIRGDCTHQGGPLGEGQLEGPIVTCPWHGAMFDVTSGEVQGPPADDSEPTYDVRIQGDEVQVAVARTST